MPTAAAPPFDGEGESFANFAQAAEFRTRVTTLDFSKGASFRVLLLDPVAHDVCMAMGDERLLELGGALEIAQALRIYFAPDAIVSIY